MHSTDRLIKAIEATGNPSVMGLDTQYTHVPGEIKTQYKDTADGRIAAIGCYNRALMDALVGIVPAVKVQVAYYELLGVPGMQLFADTLAYARQMEYVVISDVKRNDIGSTAEAYAGAYLGEGAPFRSDFITVNPYLGVDGVAPFLKKGEAQGVFILVRTSNPSGSQLQDRELVQGERLYEAVGELVEEWGQTTIGQRGYSTLGAVVGATWPEQSRRLRQLMPHTFFLVPGYGAQGGGAKDLTGCFDAKGRGAIVNASRSLLTAWQRSDKPFADAVREEALRMRDEIIKAIGER